MFDGSRWGNGAHHYGTLKCRAVLGLGSARPARDRSSCQAVFRPLPSLIKPNFGRPLLQTSHHYRMRRQLRHLSDPVWGVNQKQKKVCIFQISGLHNWGQRPVWSTVNRCCPSRPIATGRPSPATASCPHADAMRSTRDLRCAPCCPAMRERRAALWDAWTREWPA